MEAALRDAVRSREHMNMSSCPVFISAESAAIVRICGDLWGAKQAVSHLAGYGRCQNAPVMGVDQTRDSGYLSSCGSLSNVPGTTGHVDHG